MGFGTFAARPAPGTAGDSYIASDGGPIWIDDGTQWRPIIDDALAFAPPAAAAWTVRSHNGIATVLADQFGATRFTFANSGGAGEEVRVASKAAPAAPYRIEARLRLLWSDRGTMLAGIGWRQSSNGSVELWTVNASGSTSVELARHRTTASNTGTAPTYTFSTEAAAAWNFGCPDDIWLAITRDVAGNRGFEWSPDGKNWTVIAGMAVAANGFITPDEVLLTAWVSFGVNGDNQGAIFDSYREIV